MKQHFYTVEVYTIDKEACMDDTIQKFVEPAILNMIWPTLVMRWLMLSPGLMKEGHMVNQCSPVAAPPALQSNGRGLPPAADLWRGQ
jgi:hypothetical protein